LVVKNLKSLPPRLNRIDGTYPLSVCSIVETPIRLVHLMLKMTSDIIDSIEQYVPERIKENNPFKENKEKFQFWYRNSIELSNLNSSVLEVRVNHN